MKKLLILILFLSLSITSIASANWFTDLFQSQQSMGATQGVLPMFYSSSTEIVPRIDDLDLHLDKSVIVGDSTSTVDGAIRYNSGDLEGLKASVWTSLTASGGSGDAFTTTSINSLATTSFTFGTSSETGLEFYITNDSVSEFTFIQINQQDTISH